MGPAWHGAERTEIWQNLEETSAEVAELLHRQQPATSVQPERVVLLGFSQGGTLATLVALKAPECFAGLLLFGTHGLFPEFFEGSEVWPGAAGLEVLHCHGGSDGMAPLDKARASAERLRRSGCRVHFSLYSDVGHTISPAMVTEARAWLVQRLGDEAMPKAEGTEEAKQALPMRQPSAFFEIGADEDDEAKQVSSAQPSSAFFDIGGDEDEEACGIDEDGYDLDTLFGFESPVVSPATSKAQEEPIVSLDGRVDWGDKPTDLDEMYDFTALNAAALAGRAAAAPPAGASLDAPLQREPHATVAAGGCAVCAEPAAAAAAAPACGDGAPSLAAAEALATSSPIHSSAVCPQDAEQAVVEDIFTEVLLEHAGGETFYIGVPPTATIRQIKEVVSLRFGLGSSLNIRLSKRTGPYGTVLEGCSNDTPLGLERHLVLHGAGFGRTAVPVASLNGAAGVKNGKPPLAVAAKRGDVEEVKRLLRWRADPNVQDLAGETALFGAAHGDHTEVAAVLLLGKADPGIRSQNGLVAADLPSVYSPAAAMLWLALGARVGAPEQHAAFAALEECTRFLVARLLALRGVRLAVRDVLSEAEWDAACA